MRIEACLLLAMFAGQVVVAQSGPPQLPPDANPSFEVAVIKRSDPSAKGLGFRLSGGRMEASHTTVCDMIKWAYNLQVNQVIGLPEWAWTQKWEVEGTIDLPGMPSKVQAQAMLRKLLAERFALKSHMEVKKLPVYGLVLNKGPLKFAKGTMERPVPALGFMEPGVLVARNSTMHELANVLQERLLDRPVVNQTDLEGRYDFMIRFQPDASQYDGVWANLPPVDPPRPDLFTAIKEQMGLTLVAKNDDVDVMVVDSVSMPSDN